MDTPLPAPSPANDYLACHIELLIHSYHTFTGRDLVDPALSPQAAAFSLYTAQAILLSHNANPDPLLRYGNRTGLALFELDWATLSTMPSRYTAESPNREERAQLLAQVTANGYIDDYTGVRISSTGKRFLIRQATVWNLIDEKGNFQGQAATFSDWQYL